MKIEQIEKELDIIKDSIKNSDVMYFDSYLGKKYKIIEHPLHKHFIISSEFYDISKIDFNTNKVIDIKKIGIGEWEIYFYIKNMEKVFSIIKTMKLIPFDTFKEENK
jgi:hypothetical protein